MTVDVAPKLKRAAACRGVGTLIDMLDQIGDGKDHQVVSLLLEGELDLRELVTFALAMLSQGR